MILADFAMICLFIYESSNSPAQLFYLHLHLTAFSWGISAEDAWRGVDVQDLLRNPTLPHVQVPDTPNPLDEFQYARLQRDVDPLSPEGGKALYRRTVDIVGRMMESA